ncbi:dienelactone hydrolase family protein [Legionella sp. km772]|uniref:dienelactone hydrolase family protein n=1 Tax=Legionella sp. km772 TaxID=2498111 RepID=UPI000F8F8228|nr:dienelactone hydrolase family protein [Legionella sp. km772]RUR09440.1 dienelactone hydrolase family protein [Legionella sp. km772]
MHTSNYIYHHGEQELHGFLAYDDKVDTPRPAVLVAHDWSGRSELMCTKAKLLAEMGYLAFALDMYGHGRIGITTDEKKALMTPFINDRLLLSERLRAAYDAVIGMEEVDSSRVAIIGFCFGGLCALDLARSGLEIKGAVSFHGLLNRPVDLKPEHIKAKILVLHGYDDPMAAPEQVNEFCQEMNEAKADWQVHMFGHVQHAFTNPDAHDQHAGLVYNSMAAKRAWNAMTQFFQEIF